MQQSVSQLDRVEQEIGDPLDLRRDGRWAGAAHRGAHHRALLSAARSCCCCRRGLKLEDVLGDFDGGPFSDGAPRMIVVAG
jgi:hypothetical protein